MRRKELDREALHEYLLTNVDRKGFYRGKEKKLRENLLLEQPEFSHILREMESNGFIQRVNKKIKVIPLDILQWTTTPTYEKK